MKLKLILAVCLAIVASGAFFILRNSSRGGRPQFDESLTTRTDTAQEPGRDTEQMAAPEFGQAAGKLVAADGGSDSLPAWSRFRGPNGTGISDAENIPINWSETENLAWKTKLPGPGASSPVLTEKLAIVTCYSGYGEDINNPGNIDDLKRHVCGVDRATGELLWTKTFASEHRDDPYQGMGVPEHGYATNSAVTDGERVIAFLGKSGVVALDLEGNEQWRVSVGNESGNRGWGTAASLMLYGDLVIVNAAEESQSLIAIHKVTGEVAWEAPAATLELCYSTPAIVRVDEQRDDLVIAVPGEIWGLNPNNGKLTWYAETSLTDNLSPSIIVDGTTVYAFGGYRSSGSLALQVGGTGDITNSAVLWTSRNSSYVATPVLINQQLHWIDDRGMYYCSDATSGELVMRSRVKQIDSGGRPVYASPVVINGNVYAQTRESGLLVIEPASEPDSELNVLAQNKFASDNSIFNATPAVDKGQLFLRSDQYLYCITAR